MIKSCKVCNSDVERAKFQGNNVFCGAKCKAVVYMPPNRKGSIWGSRQREILVKRMTGSSNPNWKTNQLSYGLVHDWLNDTYGKADHCENLDCKYPRRTTHGRLVRFPSRYEYALVKGKIYSRDRDNFVMLCVMCHRWYDLLDVEININQLCKSQ